MIEELKRSQASMQALPPKRLLNDDADTMEVREPQFHKHLSQPESAGQSEKFPF